MSTSHISTFSSREFAHELARVKRAASEGTVFITDRGEPKFALMAIDHYWRLTSEGHAGRSLLDVMDALPSTEGIDFEPPARQHAIQPADLD